MIPRSPHWPALEHKVLKAHPVCSACSQASKLQVHHILPFHFCVAAGRPDLELDERNLIVLCEDHHLLIGHLDSFKSYNVTVVDGVKQYANMTADQIRSAASWKALVAARPAAVEDMVAFRHLCDMRYPLQH